MSMGLASQVGQFLKFLTQKYLLSIHQDRQKHKNQEYFHP